MKKFMKDLEKELKKLMINEKDIEEILADHREMIETALHEGLSEAELSTKFGNPASIAKELHADTSHQSVKNDDVYSNVKSIEGYTLFDSFMVIEDNYNVVVKLVSEDAECKPHNSEMIEVYYKGKIDKYVTSYDANVFTLKKRNKFSIFEFGQETEFLIYLPKGKNITDFNFSTTSGDSEIEGVLADVANINSVSGDIELEHVAFQKTEVHTVSGDVEITNSELGEGVFQTVSGDGEIRQSEIAGELRLKTVSGDFELFEVTAGNTFIKSVSGDIEGEEFYPISVSLSSISGDISIENTDHSRGIEIKKKKSISGDININGVES